MQQVPFLAHTARFLRDEDGAQLVEYALIIAVVSVWLGALATGQRFDRHGRGSHPTTSTASVPVGDDQDDDWDDERHDHRDDHRDDHRADHRDDHRGRGNGLGDSAATARA